VSESPLRVPDGRQGPGPAPRPVVDALDLAVARRVVGALPGDRVATGLGAGTELAQLRPYEVGDDVRQIDPSATARTGEPHVRLHVPERILTTWIVHDVSPSMAFGTARRLKADVAEGVTLVLARLAVRRAGRVALVTFGAGRSQVLPPHGARPAIAGIRRILGQGIARDGVSDPEGLSGALVQVGRLSGQPGLVVVVSDFRDQLGWIPTLGALGARHSVVAVEVGDPREGEIPAAGHLALVDPETGRRIEVDASSAKVRRAFSRIEAERRERVARDLRRLRLEHVVLSTDRDWLADLGRALA
jgi:uncharacterized protein (DUF58 family)